METTFTPIPGLIGGALIGLRLAFLIGLPLGAGIAKLATDDAMGFSIDASRVQLIAGGLLVGVGTQLGNGCTSGHGICGVARGSRRSIVATVSFMAAAAITVFIMRHVVGGAA
jgi:uncharacterized membrane protein YedE/YeeE